MKIKPIHIIIIIAIIIIYFWYKKSTAGNIEENETERTKEFEDSKKAVETQETHHIVEVPIIQNVLIDYNNYCLQKGWRNNFKADIETARNIYTHYYIETGGGLYLHDNNTHNITIGGWTTQEKMYRCSPYIRDVYGHKYLGIRERKDIGSRIEVQKFRMYEDIKDGLMDYIDLINRSKRYTGIPKLYSNPDPVFIRELKRAGYYEAKDLYTQAKALKKQWGWL